MNILITHHFYMHVTHNFSLEKKGSLILMDKELVSETHFAKKKRMVGWNPGDKIRSATVRETAPVRLPWTRARSHPLIFEMAV